MPIPGRGTILQGIVIVDPPSIAGGSSANVDVRVPHLSIGDNVMVQCCDTLEAGLVPQAAWVPASGILRIRIYNSTTTAIDGAARRWLWRVVRA